MIRPNVSKWLAATLAAVTISSQVSIVSAQTPPASVLEPGAPKQVFVRGRSTGPVQRVVTQKDGRQLDVQVSQEAGQYKVRAATPGAQSLELKESDRLIEEVYVGDLNSDGLGDVAISTRKDGKDLGIQVYSLRNQKWEPILNKDGMANARLTFSGNTLISSIPQPNGGQLDQFFWYSDEDGKYHDRFKQYLSAEAVASDVTIAADQGISSAEEAALHITAHAEGSMTPWNGPNQPYVSTQGGYLYGLTSTNWDGALLSYGMKQWNFWSFTLPPLLWRLEDVNATAFWNAFNGLDTTTFRTEVMNRSTTASRAYEWARLRVPNGSWQIYGTGAACSGYNTSTNCRWTGGEIESAWQQAFARLGEVAAFQTEQRKISYENYLHPSQEVTYNGDGTVKYGSGAYTKLNGWTSRTWSLRTFAVLSDIHNQFGFGQTADEPCSLNGWTVSGTCSRSTEGSVNRWYQSGLSDQNNVKNQVVWLTPSAQRNATPRQVVISNGSGVVNGETVNWDTYFSQYSVSLNSAPVFRGIPFSQSTVTSISVSPASVSLGVGSGQQLTATANYSDGTTQNITSTATWSTNNSGAASVSSSGFVTAMGPGSATITATYNGKTSTAAVSVTCTTGSHFDCPFSLSGSTSGSVVQGGNNYYQFYASAGTTYTVTLTPSSGDPDLYAYDPSRNLLGSSAAGTGPDTVTVSASTSGYYYAKVSGYSAANYTLSVASSSCTGGSGFDCAISLNGSTSGSVSSGQNIYYKFTVGSGTSYTVTLTPSSGDPDLSVYDASRNLIGSSAAGAGSTDTVTFTASSTGTYYIKVYGYSAASYTLSVSGGGGTCSNGTSFDCAIVLTSSTSGSVSSGQNIYYKFYAYAGSSYTVSLTPSSGDPDLSVYDVNRNLIGSSAGGTGVTDRVTFSATSTGYHYIRVTGYTSASYTLGF